MKKVMAMLLCSAMVFSFCSCGNKQDAKLLGKASSETSGMGLYYFDGEKTTVKWIFDKTEDKIISDINNLNTKSVDSSRISDMTFPCYGLQIGDTTGTEIWLTYSNGLWLTKDGSLYEAKFDFATAYNNAVDEDSSSFPGGRILPNSALLGRQDPRFYEKAGDMSSEKDGISMSFVSRKDKIVTVKLKNSSNDTFMYGMAYTLQKEINGEWYTLPTYYSWAFNELAYYLPAGEENEEECNLTPYGELEKGHYRIEKEGIVAEFEI